MSPEIELPLSPDGCILTNCNVWSPDSRWIVYDTRSAAAGDVFDGSRIEAVNVGTGETRTLYESRNGAHCGAATWHPREMKVIFIVGPEHPTPDWIYGPSHRDGMIVEFDNPGVGIPFDARDLSGSTPGAHSGGTHLHVWHPLGDWVSFTYEDAVSPRGRNIGIGVPGNVAVTATHPRNRDGTFRCGIVTRTDARLIRCCEEAWIGSSRRLALQGEIGNRREVFIVELDDNASTVKIRKLTDSHYGLAGPRHWLHSSFDGKWIGFYQCDDADVPQLWIVSPDGGEPRQVTRGTHPVASAFTWHPDGQRVALVRNNAVCLVNVETEEVLELTSPGDPIRPEACVVSPDGGRIAFVRRSDERNRICIVEA